MRRRSRTTRAGSSELPREAAARRAARDTGVSPDGELFERAVASLDPQTVGAVLEQKEPAPGGEVAKPVPPRRHRRRAASDNDAPPAIDLHRLDRATALERLARYLAAQPRGSVVLVVHGRGEMILANAVARFLDLDRSVAEHETAPPRWGGAGARIVRLR